MREWHGSLLGSRFFSDLQGQRVGHRNKVYDAHVLEEAPLSESEPLQGQQANLASGYAAWDEPDDEIEPAYLAAMVAAEDGDALHVQGFEDELEAFMQDTPEMYEALVSYTEARSRLLAKKRSRGFWPVGSGNVGSKGSQGSSSSKGGRFGKGKHAKGKSGREQLLQRPSMLTRKGLTMPRSSLSLPMTRCVLPRPCLSNTVFPHLLSVVGYVLW